MQRHFNQGALTYLTIQTTWPEKGWVESVGTVCGHDYFNLGGEGKGGDFNKSRRRNSILYNIGDELTFRTTTSTKKLKK